MRVLVVSGEWFPDRASGFARVVADTARGLADRGHDVTALVPRMRGGAPLALEGSLAIHRVIERGLLPQSFTDIRQTARQTRSLRDPRFDVAVAHGPGNVLGLSRVLPRTPIVLVFHASHSRELRYERSHMPLGRRRLAMYALERSFARFERRAMHRVDRVLVLSEFSRSIVEEDHPAVSSRIRRVSGGVDVERFSPADGQAAARERLGLRPGGPLLVTVRRLEPRMGLDQLLHAVRRIRSERPVELAIVGSGTLERRLRELARELGIAGAVRFAGRVDDADLPDWYRAADLFVLPTAAYEGFGMVTAEALASGTPVVGTPVGATPELLAPLDPRLIARAADAEALAEAIARTIKLVGPAFGERCSEFARSTFAWERTIDAWEQALLDVCRETTRPADAPLTRPLAVPE